MSNPKVINSRLTARVALAVWSGETDSKTISEVTGVEKRSVARALLRLESAGLVKRCESEGPLGKRDAWLTCNGVLWRERIAEQCRALVRVTDRRSRRRRAI